LQDRALQLFDDSLPKLGYLVLGAKETMKYSVLQDKYKQFDKEKIWRKMK
jgi:chemotaxis protein methyltransferase CheR